MNRIDKLFEQKKDVLNIYFTAGYPEVADTLKVAQALEGAGADLLEIGMPFSDPIADGPTIQQSSAQALSHGMSIALLLDQLKELRSNVEIPVLLMGYINPILQYGIDRFVKQASEVGVDGLIVPDLPMQEYLDDYKEKFAKHGIHNIFLISPNTSENRIKVIDQESNGFIYMVSSSSITGAKSKESEGQIAYYKRIADMGLRNPRLIGFGISNHETFANACKYADGAIIGSAFIEQLKDDPSREGITKFIKGIKGK